MVTNPEANHVLLARIDERLKNIEDSFRINIDMLTKRLETLEGIRILALSRDPFSAEREGNGNTALRRLEVVEQEITDTKMFLRGLWRGFLGFGILNALVIVITFWDKITQVIQASTP